MVSGGHREWGSDAVLSADTAAETELRQVELWRRMTPAQKARAVSDISSTVRNLALAGIRHRYPAATERECFLRLARITLGHEVACQVYPEISSLSD